MNSEQVKGWQRFLANAGFYFGLIDGNFGPLTITATIAWSQATGNFLNAPKSISVTSTLSGVGFCGIYDFNRASEPDWQAMWDAGIRAVIHKVSEGIIAWPESYQARRAEAKRRGFLWGGYHFSHGGNPEAQARVFLDAAQFSDDEVVALDWEEGGEPNMTLAESEIFCSTVKNSLGRYPIVYGGGLLRDQLQNRTSPILAQCPLWYVQVQAHARPTGIPSQVWPNGAILHQYWSQDLEDQVPGIAAAWGADFPCNDLGCRGADRSRFFGTEDELRATWPFTRKAQV